MPESGRSEAKAPRRPVAPAEEERERNIRRILHARSRHTGACTLGVAARGAAA